jgi:hypothetical protein
MAAGYLDLFIDQGQDFSATITLDNMNGGSYNTAGYFAEGTIKSSYISANAAAYFNTTIDATGDLTISLDYLTTQNLSYGRYVYDVFLINPANTHSKVLEGIVYLNPSATTFT